MKRKIAKTILMASFIFFLESEVFGAFISLSSVKTTILSVVRDFASVAAIVCGVYGFTKSGWKFSDGATDAVPSLLGAIVGYVLVSVVVIQML